MNKLTLIAPAKINIGLNIVSKRTDGFHNLETFFYPINDLYDEITFEKNDEVIFDSNNELLVIDASNLVLKAFGLIEKLAQQNINVKIYLEKNIPIGAGLGGGSSNAACTLLGLNKLFDLNLSLDVLHALALQLGSDVPFFIESKPAIGYSRGEILKKTHTKIDYPILIVNPGIHISTKEAFQNIIPRKPAFDYDYFAQTQNIDFNFINDKLTNDFEPNVMGTYSEIKEIKESMIDAGALFSLMSGTGSTVYGIFENSEQAQKVLENLPSSYFKFLSHEVFSTNE